MIENIITPTVNLNGTSADELLRQNIAAVKAIRDAFRALQTAAPHGRDYQTVPEERFRLARHQHNARMEKLDDILQELETIITEIQASESFRLPSEQPLKRLVEAARGVLNDHHTDERLSCIIELQNAVDATQYSRLATEEN